MIYVKVLLLIVLLSILSLLWGSLFTKKEEFSLGELLLLGIIKIFSCFQIICVPMILMRAAFGWMCLIFGGLFLVGSVAAVVLHGRQVCSLVIHELKVLRHDCRALQLLFLAVIVFQVGVAAYSTYIDDDDSFYVGAAVTTLETDTMYQYQAETGLLADELPSRYIFSPFAMFIAFLSRISQIPPAVVSHTALFPFLIILSYIVYGLLGKLFFGKNRDCRNIFMFLVAIVSLMGYYSVYSVSVFTLLRGHQGKGVLAGIMIPLALYFLLKYCGEQGECRWKFSVFFFVSAASSLISSMGIMLMPVVLGTGGLIYTFKTKSIKPAVQMVLSCLPSVVYGLIYYAVVTGRIVL